MASEEYKESDLSKIVKRLMDEEGFEFGEAVKEAMEQTKNFESKADGGSIGIEVLFTDKMANGGRAGYVSGGAALKLLEKGKEGIASLYNAGKSIFSKGDDVVDLAKQEEIFRSGDITTDFLENVDDKVIKKFVATRDAKGPGGYGLYDSFDDMPNGLKAAELISRIKNAEGGINYEAAELFIGKKLKGNETVDELISMVITEKKADGGRVGLFMGGPALEGEALAIYNSMNTYGATDQEIADRLGSMGLYDPSDSTPDPTPDPGQGGSQSAGGGGGSPVSLFGKNLNSTFTRPPGSEPKISKDAFFGLGKFFQGQEQGTLGDRRLKAYNNPMLPSFVGALGKKMSPFNPNSKNYNPNMASQLNFLEMGQIGDETGLSLVGYDPGSGLMKYGSDSVLAGKNVISGFGTNDYEKMLMDYIGKMSVNQKISDDAKKARIKKAKLELAALTGQNAADINADTINTQLKIAGANNVSTQEAAGIMAAIERDQQRDSGRGGGADMGGSGYSSGSGYNEGNYCFDPSTLIQMADGSTKEIKNIQLGDDTKGGEVTGVFQFKATDEIHDYKGVTVAGSHYVKEDGKFIMVKDSPLSVKIDKIPVVYSLDTTGRRIFINDIEFADYNGDGVAKNFLTNAGVDLTGFDTEVLRQVEHRLI